MVYGGVGSLQYIGCVWEGIKFNLGVVIYGYEERDITACVFGIGFSEQFKYGYICIEKVNICCMGGGTIVRVG